MRMDIHSNRQNREDHHRNRWSENKKAQNHPGTERVERNRILLSAWKILNGTDLESIRLKPGPAAKPGRKDKDMINKILEMRNDYVEKDTGYEIDLIYDIFVEQIEDEREDGLDIDDAIGAAAYWTLIPAYELDY